jgi:phosphoribosylformylglycinamidine synthase
MLLQKYTELHQDIFTVNIEPEAILEIDDIDAYTNKKV